MKNYKQLSQEQRYVIGRLLKAGKTQQEIATTVGAHKSTISRELKRNVAKRGRGAKEYKPDKAQQKTQLRHRIKAKRIRFTACMRKQTIKWLTEDKLSPELISAKGKQRYGEFVSCETIYNWIWEMKHSQKKEHQPYRMLYQELKHGRRHRKRGNYHQNRGCIPDRVSIEKRPALIGKRKRLGDMEVDLMMGKNHQGALLVIIDRATLKTSLTKLKTKASAPIAKAILHKMKPCADWIKTFTYDNDMAFTKHQTINEVLKTKSYFTRPYTSQDKGTVENRIGILRRFFPKKTDFTKVTFREVKRVEKLLNERPVRKFNYQTPNAVFLQKIKRSP